MSTAIGVSLDLCETNTSQRSAFSVASRMDRLSYVSCPPAKYVAIYSSFWVRRESAFRICRPRQTSFRC